MLSTITTKATEFLATTTGKVVAGTIGAVVVGYAAKKGYDLYTGRKNKASDIAMDVAEKVEVAENLATKAKEGLAKQVEDLKEELRQTREAAANAVNQIKETKVEVEVSKEGVSIETSNVNEDKKDWLESDLQVAPDPNVILYIDERTGEAYPVRLSKKLEEKPRKSKPKSRQAGRRQSGKNLARDAMAEYEEERQFLS